MNGQTGSIGWARVDTCSSIRELADSDARSADLRAALDTPGKASTPRARGSRFRLSATAPL
jgi:hypothetical protein